MVMPVIVLGTGLAAVIMRQTRAAMIEALGADYVRTARAKGLRESQVIWIHALRNSLVTVVTVVGLQLGGLIAGVVTVEVVFNIPEHRTTHARLGLPAGLPDAARGGPADRRRVHHREPADRRVLHAHQPAAAGHRRGTS